jgi:phosphoribosylformimino-5-aminoimidazole carboxamide ribotide isomerase
MKIYPAIDLIDGNVVRLLKGDYGAVTNYSKSPEDVAKEFYQDGARYLHVVDLDGAKAGKACNAEVICKIISHYNLKVEIGGGVRTESQIEDYLKAGADRVILGTVAVTNFAFVENMVKKYGEKIAVGVDAKDGFVCVSGWQKKTEIDSFQFCKKLADCGVKNIIYTDISRDGTLSGTNISAYEKLVKIQGVKFYASGGVTNISEIEKLQLIGVDGVILGKALYEGKLSLKEAIEVLGGV